MTNLQYITLEGERWDNIAFKAYGNAGLAEILIIANPSITITDVLPTGTLLNIPVKEDEAVLTNQELLPPWLKS